MVMGKKPNLKPNQISIWFNVDGIPNHDKGEIKPTLGISIQKLRRFQVLSKKDLEGFIDDGK